jgi:hypothetical protein
MSYCHYIHFWLHYFHNIHYNIIYSSCLIVYILFDIHSNTHFIHFWLYILIIYVYCVYIYTIYTIYTIYSLTFTQTLTIYTLYTFDYTLSIIVTIASLCVYPLCLTIWLCGGECFQSKYLHNARNIPELSQLTLWVHSRWHKEIARIYRWSGIPILRAHIC